jgi:hypothetical protein
MVMMDGWWLIFLGFKQMIGQMSVSNFQVEASKSAPSQPQSSQPY